MLLLEGEGFKHAQLVQMSLQGVVSVHVASKAPETAEGWDLVFIHYDSFPPPVRTEILRRFDEFRHQGRLLTYVSTPSRETIAFLLADSRVTHIVASVCAPDTEELLVTVRKIMGADIFGIDKYFPQASSSKTLSIDSTRQKSEVLNIAAAFARDAARPKRLIDQFTTTVDEIVNNALFNAPIDETGRSRYAHFPRTETITLEPGEQVALELRCDGCRLGVSVTDPFGTLTVEGLTRHVGQHVGVPTGKRSSAGVGLFSVLSLVSHLAVNLAPAHKTEFIALLDIRGGTYRDFVRRGTTFNLFLGHE